MSKKGNVYKKILIVKLSSLGDIIHALPVLNALKENIPDSLISWAVEPQYAELLRGHPALAQVIPVNLKFWRKNFWKSTKKVCYDMKDTVLLFKKQNFDLAIDLQGLTKSALVSGLSGARHRLGIHPGYCREPLAAGFYTRWVQPCGTHVIEQNLSLLRALDIDKPEVKFNFKIPDQERLWANNWINEHFQTVNKKKLIIVHPGTRWQSKQWPVEKYIELLNQLCSEKCTLVLAGSGEEKNLLAQIASALNKSIVQLSDISIKQYMALLAKGDLFISSDTGPLHLAAALGLRTISFYGPTRNGPLRNGPWGTGHKMFCLDLDCIGCHKKHCSHKDCMQQIKVDNVLHEVKMLID